MSARVRGIAIVERLAAEWADGWRIGLVWGILAKVETLVILKSGLRLFTVGVNP
jgi:hypothetical protein